MSDIEKPSHWNSAALDGLILSTVTILFTTLSMLISSSFVNVVFWLLRTTGSVWLLIYLIRRYVSEIPAQRPFGYGTSVCLFSSVICGTWNFVCFKFLFLSKTGEAFEQLYSQFNQMNIPAETMDMIYMMEDNYPALMFVTGFIGAFLFGLIASAIIQSSMDRNRDIFADGSASPADREEEEDF